MSARPAQLVVTGNQIRLQQCGLYKVHFCAIVQAHHVCPESWWRHAGKPAGSPLKDLCPNCHYSTHAAIDGIIKGQDVTALPRRCVTLARQAFPLAEAAGLTPSLTL